MDGQVVVVGGGIGGLTTALALARRGIQVTVHERAPELQEIGAGLGLWPAPLRVFDRLGIGDDVRALSGPWRDAGLRRADGRFLVRYTSEQFSARLGEPTIGVHRGELQALLLRSLGGGVVHTSHELTDVEQSGTTVTAHFAGGATVSGAVLIGADGRRSTVRRHLFGDQPLHDCRSVGWRGTATAPPDSDWHEQIGETWGPGGRFGILPISDNRVTWYAAARTLRNGGGIDELLDRFGSWHHPIPELIAATDPANLWWDTLDDRRPSRRWVSGRVALLGDAAHPMTADLGQGACQAILDAEVLAEELDGRANVTEALRTYERRRRWRAGAVTMIARGATVGARPEGRVAVAFRSRMASLMPASVMLRELELITRGP
jgi:2-polyprenyl-6-methoxyphenol hydroxylase-like FAD-dependent oxidoreductase